MNTVIRAGATALDESLLLIGAGGPIYLQNKVNGYVGGAFRQKKMYILE